jgi:hypothetical protein
LSKTKSRNAAWASSIDHFQNPTNAASEIAAEAWLPAARQRYAVSVGYIAHFDFGLSREEIRGLAVFGAGVISALVATEYFGKKLRKP